MITPGGYCDAAEFAIHPWTPTFTAVTAGSGYSLEGWYTNVNGLVAASFVLVFGTSPSFSATIRVALPVTADAPALQTTVGWWGFRDTDAGEHYAGSVGAWSPDGEDASFGGCWDGTAPRSRITNGKPVTVAAGDVLSCGLSYRADAS